jgi:translation elongation factor EF-1alpha
MNTFKVNNCFRITDRGYVLSGEIVSGEISSGQSIVIDSDRSIRISSVEFVDYPGGISKVGLLLKIDSDELIAGLIGQIISIV